MKTEKMREWRMKIGENIPFEHSATFISSYISSYYPSKNKIIDQFGKMDGFNLFGKFISRHCPYAIHWIFDGLIPSTKANAQVVKCLGNVYLNEESTQAIRYASLECFLNVSRLTEHRDRMFNSVLLSQRFMKPPKFDKEYIEALIDFAEAMISGDIIPIQQFLPQLLAIITPPVPQEVPIDKYFEMISKELLRGILLPNEMFRPALS